ncbi:MAG: hypothetical protein ACE5M4_09135 [Anaerolineales bacterium]
MAKKSEKGSRPDDITDAMRIGALEAEIEAMRSQQARAWVVLLVLMRRAGNRTVIDDEEMDQGEESWALLSRRTEDDTGNMVWLERIRESG